MKDQWKQLSKYQVHRYKWLCENHAHIDGKTEKEITQSVKETWRAKVKEAADKMKERREREKNILLKRREGKSAILRRVRDETTRTQWMKKCGKKPKLREGEEFSDYSIFRFGYMELHRD